LIFPIRTCGPKQMVVRAASLAFQPLAPISVEIIDRPRVGITVVEVLDFRRYIR
jgi:hypothetical protein